jgi:hypothetical protein
VLPLTTKGEPHYAKLIQSLTTYRKHWASGQAAVAINGRDHYLGPHGTKASKLEYDRLIAEFLTSGRSASFGALPHDLTVVELLVDYVHYAKAYYGRPRRASTSASCG